MAFHGPLEADCGVSARPPADSGVDSGPEMHPDEPEHQVEALG